MRSSRRETILEKLCHLTARDDWEETTGPDIKVLDNCTWFINGNFESACIDNDDKLVTISDSDETVIYRGNFQ